MMDRELFATAAAAIMSAGSLYLLSRTEDKQSLAPVQYTTGTHTFKVPYWVNRMSWRVVEVDLNKLDRYWRDDVDYVQRGGGNDNQPYKYDRFEEWLKSNPRTAIEMPRLGFLHGKAGFIDGRHRTAVMRDQGFGTAFVLVNKGRSETEARRLLSPSNGRGRPLTAIVRPWPYRRHGLTSDTLRRRVSRGEEVTIIFRGNGWGKLAYEIVEGRGHVTDLVLDRSLRGTGIGSEIVDRMHLDMSNKLVTQVRLEAENEDARRFWARNGYVGKGKNRSGFTIMRRKL